MDALVSEENGRTGAEVPVGRICLDREKEEPTALGALGVVVGEVDNRCDGHEHEEEDDARARRKSEHRRKWEDEPRWDYEDDGPAETSDAAESRENGRVARVFHAPYSAN